MRRNANIREKPAFPQILSLAAGKNFLKIFDSALFHYCNRRDCDDNSHIPNGDSIKRKEIKMAKETVECPKCLGRGHFEVFGHVANGVCFCCKGKKTIVIDVEKLQIRISPENRRRAEWILASNEQSYSKLSYEKLLAIRDFAHGGWGLSEAYPTMLAHYREVGEPAFQAAQAEKLASLRV